MRGAGRLGASAILAMAALSCAAVATVPSAARAGFTRGAHTARRRGPTVTPLPKSHDSEIARWNAAVDQRKAERNARRGR